MAAKFIELKQAAEMLGVSTDEVNDMRLRGDILAVRDGSGWKFKEDELHRAADNLGISLHDEAEATGGSESDLALDVDEDEFASSPTEIGKVEDLDAGDLDDSAEEAPAASAGDSDLGFDLATESDLDLAGGAGSSDVALVPDAGGSGLNLVADDDADDILAGSDLNLDPSGTGDGGTGDLDFEGSDLELGSDLSLGDDLSLDEDSDDELTLGVEDDDELALTDDDELVLDGGSDVTGGAGDTGINLTSPSDSGLNLEEEPMELAGSSVSSLELPEDDDLGDLEDLDAELPGDEDFQLAPSGDLEDNEEDSGSQVIALEDSEAFAEGAALEDVEEEAVLGAEPVDELEGALDEAEAVPVTQPALADSAYMAAPPEIPYSVWNVLSLLVIVMLLGVTGMLMTDLVRNMWTWNEAYSASTPIMDMMIRMFGLEP